MRSVSSSSACATAVLMLRTSSTFGWCALSCSLYVSILKTRQPSASRNGLFLSCESRHSSQKRRAEWRTRLHLRTSGCRTRADSRSSSCLPVPARGRPDGVKQRWRRHRSNSAPSGPAVFAADSDCDLPAACRVALETEPFIIRRAGLLVRAVHLTTCTKRAAVAIPASAILSVRHCRSERLAEKEDTVAGQVEMFSSTNNISK